MCGEGGGKPVCREVTTCEADSEGNAVCEGNAGEGLGGCGEWSRGPQPDFNCHVHPCLKVASLALKDSYED